MPAPQQRRCEIADQHEVVPGGMLGSTMFIPTRVDRRVDERSCEPSAENGWSCTKAWTTLKHDNVFLASIEDFTLMIAHSYSRRHVSGNSLSAAGFYYECQDKNRNVSPTRGCEERGHKLKRIKIHCYKKGKCHQWTPEDETLVFPDGEPENWEANPSIGNETTSSAVFVNGNRYEVALDSRGQIPEVFAIPEGDVFSLRKVLQLAGLELDKEWNKDSESLRVAGTSLQIQVSYSNMHHIYSSFGRDNVGYVYGMIGLPMDEMKQEIYAPLQPSGNKRRYLENQHGLYVDVHVGGTFGIFSVVYLLVMLTTSLALLAMATKITDMLAVFALREKESYYKCKFEEIDREQVDQMLQKEEHADA
mmetsp:Transcript_72820/g.167162  ORF Transcript_72820/g.167162 Transcript_72820/m.167162 type:complete len:362 (+) Transcript_72820:384-1469(+)